MAPSRPEFPRAAAAGLLLAALLVAAALASRGRDGEPSGALPSASPVALLSHGGALPSASPAALPSHALHVPRAAASIQLDGKVDDWQGVHAMTGNFVSVDGRNAPDSEARLLWREGALYLLLYAADRDIRSSVHTHDAPLWPEDAFKITFRTAGEARARVIYVSPNGTLTDQIQIGERVDPSWESKARVGHDLDGTPNDASDEDEEWKIELAIPLASLGLRGVAGESLSLSIRRCDVPKGADRRCAAWGEPEGAIVLE
ncbi:MAG: carbohydrate-binding family 9-like protein [Polyangiaceae bacterium]